MKILFFAPHSAIWVHAFPEALVAEALQQKGHEIIYVACGRALRTHCVSMSAARVTIDAPAADKDAVCDRCERNAALIRERFAFRWLTLDELLTEGDRRSAREIADRATPETFLDIHLDGVEIGRSALGTFLLQYKKISFQFSDAEWHAFKAELQNTLLAFHGVRRLLDDERPDRVMVYSPGYSVNLAVCRLAVARGIGQYYMNAGSNLTDRLQKVVLARGSSLQRRLLGYWPRYRDKPCAPPVMRYVTDHVLEILRGRSALVYSAGRSHREAGELRSELGIPEDARVLLATMSSYDELFAAEATGLFPSDYRTPFATQLDWIKALVAWVGARKDLFLLIRVHPRELPNKRESVKSEHARLLEAELSRLPANCRVNWPSDGLSLYDVMEITDVCVNSWSTAGKEMSLFGIPTVIYSPDLVFYAQDLNYVGETAEAYFRAVEQALDDGWNAEISRRLYRWQALEDFYSRIDISESFQRDEHHIPPLPVRAWNRARRVVDPLWREKRDARRRVAALERARLIERVLKEGHDSILDVLSPDDFPGATHAEETAALRGELRRLMEALYPEPQAPAAGRSLKAKLQSFVFPAA
jgi:hypothetical protein